MTHLMLGTPVVYTERAAVARRPESHYKGQPREWMLPARGNGDVPGISPHGGEYVITFWLGKITRIALTFVDGEGKALAPEKVEKLNRAIVTWPGEGSGVITALETKAFGVSHGARGDGETGWLESHGQIKLYVVRSQLEGHHYVHVPTWAVRPMVPA